MDVTDQIIELGFLVDLGTKVLRFLKMSLILIFLIFPFFIV